MKYLSNIIVQGYNCSATGFMVRIEIGTVANKHMNKNYIASPKLKRT